MSCHAVNSAKIYAPRNCGCGGNQEPVFAVVARLKREFGSMPGLVSINAYTAGFSPYVIVQLNGKGAWRAEQIGRGMRWNSDPGAKTAENNVTVLFQSMPYAGTGGDEATWTQRLKADPRYQDAARVLSTARYSNYLWEKARAFIFGDAFVMSVYRKEPNARFDTPPREPSAFGPCGRC